MDKTWTFAGKAAAIKARTRDCSKSTYFQDPVTKVYDRHMDTVYRVCLSMLGNRQDAEDAVQSVFLTLLERKKTFNNAEHEKAWLIRAAMNKCRDHHRKWWKRKVVHVDPHFMPEPNRQAQGEHAELAEQLQALPPSYRVILYLYYYEGYKLSEIAAMLRMNPNTVKTRMRNARKRLKFEMGDGLE